MLPAGFFAQTSALSVEKIMQDPKWMGTFPSSIQWGAQGENIYFYYNPEKNAADSLYKINLSKKDRIVKVSRDEREEMMGRRGEFDADKSKKIYTDDQNLYIYTLRDKSRKLILDIPSRIEDPVFLNGSNIIGFESQDNAFLYNLTEGTLKQLTNINKGSEKSKTEDEISERDEWIQTENLELLEVVAERKKRAEDSKKYRESIQEKEKFEFFTKEKNVGNMTIAPSAAYVSFNLIDRERGKSTAVPNYVDVSGYTVDLPARSKVGDFEYTADLIIYNTEKDTAYTIDFSGLPGIKDLPDYTSEYPDKEWEEKAREVIPSTVKFSEDGKNAVVNVRSTDNKDRWIVALNLEDGSIKSLDRQRDEAWLAGPGIGYTFYGYETLDWLPDNKHIYFQSEESGFSHLYLLNTKTGKKTQLTKGDFEVFDPVLSNDKKHWYLSTSEVDAGERHFYRMPLMGGKMEKLTNMPGNNQVYLSPDETQMAISHSTANKPWELYLKKTGSSEKAEQLTQGQSDEFASYNWREPEYIQFKARDGAMVPARLYIPETRVKNDAAVVFVHGAGYLQNAHKWWSSYFHEYMFHNLLTDLGYTVIDIDYRGSAGYGRDWRTGIYRHMGGKDLSDQVDGVKYLIENQNIDPQKVGIYGGSYGGFITLMAMFNEPETFQAGAALRSVTDWAHYNHGYTANILNEPSQDPIAYRQSSPIYFAEGLQGDLLIAHGMLDVNVHFQDVVRLAQRLIELKKENWELAVYPVEDHGFEEPSSWTDEYRRILELFNKSLLGK
nr:S9 family peptidase [Gramella sp. AN32]